VMWHIAFAVDDLEQAMEQWGQALNLQWQVVRRVTVPRTDEHGNHFDVDTKFAIAAGLPYAIEVFEQTPGTPLAAPEGTTFHHIGYWAQDMVAEARRLESLGWRCTGGPIVPDSRSLFFTGSLGITIEPCFLGVSRPGLEEYYPREGTE
jgi:hypothetical protein